MNYSCESFMDYAYEEDIVMEAFHPIRRIQDLITKIHGALMKLVLKFRTRQKVRIFVPNEIANAFKVCHRSFMFMNDQLYKSIRNNNTMISSDKTDDYLNRIKNLREYKLIMEANRAESKEDFEGKKPNDFTIFDADVSSEIIKVMNEGIDALTKFKIGSRVTEAGEDTMNAAKSAIKFYNIFIKFYYKIYQLGYPEDIFKRKS